MSTEFKFGKGGNLVDDKGVATRGKDINPDGLRSENVKAAKPKAKKKGKAKK